MNRQTIISVLIWGGLYACGQPISESSLSKYSSKKSEADSEEKIVNGVIEAGMPGVVALVGPGGKLCTGSLVAPTVILTAAHCVTYQGRPKGLTEALVTNGVDQWPQESARIVASEVFPRWRESESASFDLATMVLDRPLVTRPMQMHFDSVQSLLGRDVEVVGFGVTNGVSQTGSGTKRSTSMTLSKIFLGGFDVVTPPNRQTDSCQGDSGGPALAQVAGRTVILGVVSRGPADCGGLTHFTGLSDKEAWLRERLSAAGYQTEDAVSLQTTTEVTGDEASSIDDPQAPTDIPEDGTSVCHYRNDGMCDEPLLCPLGTDAEDCTENPTSQLQDETPEESMVLEDLESGDTCTYANDGVCDEPFFCPEGTDESDCADTVWSDE